jgi:hypothetical protein
VLVNVANYEKGNRRIYRFVEYTELVFVSEAELVLMKLKFAQLPVMSDQEFVESFQ